MHDVLFSEPGRLAGGYDVEGARALGLEPRRFVACLAGEAVDRVRADIVEARRLGVKGTPTFFFGRLRADGRVVVARRHAGSLTIRTFDRLVREATMAPAAAGTR
jgi:predicted DsbA family dithiol-disulfide isomerase